MPQPAHPGPAGAPDPQHRGPAQPPNANSPQPPSAAPPQASNAGPPDPASAGGVSRDQLKSAIKAFKKRLKLARLDDESRLGHGPLSPGGRSGIVAITPPAQFPPAVWEELVRQGKLRPAGRGMYELGAELDSGT